MTSGRPLGPSNPIRTQAIEPGYNAFDDDDGADEIVGGMLAIDDPERWSPFRRRSPSQVGPVWGLTHFPCRLLTLRP